MESIDIASILSLVNLTLSFSLLFVYVKNYLKVRVPFTLGLIVFALLFFIQNFAAIYFQFAMIMYYTSEVATFALVLNLLETIALSSLVYVTYKT